MTPPTGLTLCRSDMGDGGWSLHPADVTDGEIAAGIADLLSCGEAEWEEQAQRWSRPDAGDYEQALLALAGVTR